MDCTKIIKTKVSESILKNMLYTLMESEIIAIVTRKLHGSSRGPAV